MVFSQLYTFVPNSSQKQKKMKANFDSWFHSFEFSLSKCVKLYTKEWVL